MSKKVHLVLGSGGARGIAHIAIIEELEEQGFEIIEVIGCSMGAVIGGIYASGHLQEYKDWITNLSRKDVFDLLDFTFTKQGFVKAEKIFAKHMEITGKIDIEDFNIPFTAVATDIKAHEEIHYTNGDLYKALRASVSIPGFLIPVVENGRVLVDGGVLNPLPINLVNKKDDAIIVAVDLNGSADNSLDTKGKINHHDKNEVQKWFEKLVPNHIVDTFNNQDDEKDKDEDMYSLIELMEKTYNFTQDRLTSLMIELHKPEFVIYIPRNAANTLDFHRAEQIYELGKRSFKKAFKEYESVQ